eukprot:scaffold842_cov227-Pinguiococcus_pyrenoidosus.AAC.4
MQQDGAKQMPTSLFPLLPLLPFFRRCKEWEGHGRAWSKKEALYLPLRDLRPRLVISLPNQLQLIQFEVADALRRVKDLHHHGPIRGGDGVVPVDLVLHEDALPAERVDTRLAVGHGMPKCDVLRYHLHHIPRLQVFIRQWRRLLVPMLPRRARKRRPSPSGAFPVAPARQVGMLPRNPQSPCAHPRSQKERP